MVLVVDASVAAVWCLPDEDSSLADAAIDRLRGEDALVPALFWFESRNLLLMAERRGRLQPVQTAALLVFLDALPIQADHTPSGDTLLALARRYRLTVYDAAYLELAQRTGAPLATLDRRLAAAATDEGVSLMKAE
ncbi:MAG TPA: type II toxin-antitoxin system VapC family toxin [Geminicoccaceae bacterium]|nr:type II toxin-antitoxin system VapC family toxin [Geminicoccaceae bacterium]